MVKGLSNEDIATRIVQIYFKEIARLGYKRSLKLDEVINAYYYTLSKLKDKKQVMVKVMKEVVETEKELKTETKEELLPSMTETVSKTTETTVLQE